MEKHEVEPGLEKISKEIANFIIGFALLRVHDGIADADPAGSGSLVTVGSIDQALLEDKSMRVYHFLPSEYALSDIALQRMKIARFGDLNDPFELLALNVGGDKKLRKMLRIWKRELNSTKGLLCFSKNKKNPVLWSHYAAQHYGFCLGFDLNKKLVRKIKYTAKRIPLKFDKELNWVDQNEELRQTLLLTKFRDWSYENEVRVFVDLDEHSVEGATYFYDFSRDLELREVILGPLCSISIQHVGDLVDALYDRVVVRKARLAFKFFKVVEKKS